MASSNSYFSNQIIFITVFILVHNILNLQAKSIDINNEPVCDTEICKQIADSIIKNMVQTNDPCTDFYQYACGNWREQNEESYFSVIKNTTTHRLKEILDFAASSEESSALTKAKVLYKSCMDQDAIESEGVSGLSKLMDNYGGWPMAMTEFEWNFKKKPWQDVDAAFKKLSGYSPLFSFNVQFDIKNSSQQIIWLTPASTDDVGSVFPVEFSNINDISSKLLLLENYKNAMKNASKLIAKYRGSPLSSEKTLEEDAVNVIKFEWKLSTIIINKNVTNKKPDINDIYTKISIIHFQRAYNLMFSKTANAKIDWLHLIRQYFADVPHLHIHESEVIAVSPVDYFLKLSDLLDRTPSRVIVNTIHWWLVKVLGRHSSQEMVTILDNMIPPSRSPPKAKPRWVNCVAENDMAHAIAFAYVQKYFPSKAKHAAVNMIHEIMHEMGIKINDSIWLDDYSKQGALRKLRAMKEFVGYPDWYKSSAEIDSFYKDVNVSESYLENILAVTKFKLIQKLKTLKEPVDKNKWIAIPTAVNAFYLYPGNSLTIPAGILQNPFFNDEQPDAINYGGIGTIIGHEVSHGFDDIGCQFDEEGNLRNWWTNTTRSEYYKRAQCFVVKFSDYHVSFNSTTYRVNALNTLSENIADSAGIHAVYEAFQIQKTKTLKSKMRLPGLEHLSSNQLFFLSYAHTFCARPQIDTLIAQMKIDPHSPAAFRIIGTLSNMENFAEAYQCAEGTIMNPVKKCGIW